MHNLFINESFGGCTMNHFVVSFLLTLVICCLLYDFYMFLVIILCKFQMWKDPSSWRWLIFPLKFFQFFVPLRYLYHYGGLCKGWSFLSFFFLKKKKLILQASLDTEFGNLENNSVMDNLKKN